MSKVLITGGAGFIGRNLATHLMRQGHKVRICDLPEVVFKNQQLIRPMPDVIAKDALTINWGLTDSVDYDVIINCAAISDTRCQDHELLMKTNVELPLMIARGAVMSGTPVIMVSSASIYGDRECLQARDLSDMDPQNMYAFSKLLMEQSLQPRMNTAHKLFVVRPFNVYGPGEVSKKQHTRSLIYRLIQKSHGLDSELKLHSPHATRDFIHVSDVCVMISHMMNNLHRLKEGSHVRVFNLGTGEAASVDQLASCIIGKKQLEWAKQPDGYQSHTVAQFDVNEKLTQTMDVFSGIRGMIGSFYDP